MQNVLKSLLYKIFEKSNPIIKSDPNVTTIIFPTGSLVVKSDIPEDLNHLFIFIILDGWWKQIWHGPINDECLNHLVKEIFMLLKSPNNFNSCR